LAGERSLLHGRHDRAAVPPNRIGLEIEAALAFGTGHHGTTRGCLIALDRLLKARRPRHILDVGAGTGVLAMAAARALRQPVVASDIDAVAVRTAAGNARNNRAAPWMRIVHAAGVNHPAIRRCGGYDLVFANILLGPLQRLARPLARLSAPGGHVILSGLLPAHANAACSAYRAQGLLLERRLNVDGWITLVLRDARKASPRRACGASGR
jgi:ribosomal protein L11 methyltransferase